MSKMSIEPPRHVLNGPTMGTRWSAMFHTAGAGPAPALGRIATALQAAVDEVDRQMSSWNPDSDLMRLNRAPVGAWTEIPARLAQVLGHGLSIGRASDGAFDIGMGDAVHAWGFAGEPPSPDRIRAALAASRVPAHEAIELDRDLGRVRKLAPVTLDLNGIAKGHGVDRLAETLLASGITSFLVGIDGEMRGAGLRDDGRPWTVAVEAPDPETRAAHSILALHDAAVATSGDYRHWVTVGRQRLSHTMDPRRGAPLLAPPASVTVIAETCTAADAWATALTVLGPDRGGTLARSQGLEALFLLRGADAAIETRHIGRIFAI